MGNKIYGTYKQNGGVEKLALYGKTLGKNLRKTDKDVHEKLKQLDSKFYYKKYQLH